MCRRTYRNPLKSSYPVIGSLLAALVIPSIASASYGYYVGKNLTEDGSVLLGGTGEEVSSHWLEIVPRQQYPEGATVKVGVTEAASIPGELIDIPQASETYRYLTMFYSDYEGFPAPLTNGGMNEHQVAARDIWAPSRSELVEMTPTPQLGPQYSDLSRIAMERAETAREAVEIIGDLIDRHGYSTYGGNSHLIADPDEGWVLIEFAGGQGLWVAERLGPDDVRVLYPGYMEDIPQNYQEDPDYMGSDNLIRFAVEQGWYDPESGKPFNVHEVYGKQGVSAREPRAKYLSPKQIEEMLQEMAPVSVDEMMALVRDHRITDDEAGYGQVAHLRQDIPAEIALLWVAPTGSVTAPFIPWWIGVEEVPAEFGQHRYLTKGAAASFLNPDFQAQEATRFAGRVFKRLMYYTCEHPDTFLPDVTGAIEAFEDRLLEEQASVEETALTLLEAGRADLARQYLTRYTNTTAMEGLRLGEALLAGVEARTKAIYGIRKPETDQINDPGGETVNCLAGFDPDKPPPQ